MPAAEELQQPQLWWHVVKLPAPSGLPVLVLTQPHPAPVTQPGWIGFCCNTDASSPADCVSVRAAHACSIAVNGVLTGWASAEWHADEL